MRILKALGAALLAVVASTALASPTNKYDINNDGKVDGRDAESLIMMVGYAGATGSMPAMPGSPQDLNGDGQYSIADWREFVAYVSAVGAFPEALFDVANPGMNTVAVTAPDKLAIAQAVNQGRGGYYNMRYDFNADGVVDLKDWALFASYYKRVSPQLLLDVDGNGVVNGRDLDRYAQMIDARSYDVMMDLNADGMLNAADWHIVVQLTNATSPKSLFDVDGMSANSQPVLTGADSMKIATSLNGLGIGFPVSIRYDLNGDGVVNAADWTEWVRYVTMVYKKPDMLFDVDGNGVVNSSDLAFVNASLGARPVQFQFDLNGDGVIDSRDAAMLAARLAAGPVVLIVGDVNRDGCVNQTDLALVQAAMGASSGYPLYDPDLDISANWYIGQEDLSLVTSNMGRCR